MASVRLMLASFVLIHQHSAMEFRNSKNPERPIMLVFSDGEPRVMAAAYREQIYDLAMKGNTSSISDYEAMISGWANEEVKTLIPLHYNHVATVLDEFAERTAEVIQEIPNITGLAPFVSDDIGERFRLGKLAMKLAKEIRQKGAIFKIDDPEPTVEISDESINNWLSRDSDET